MGKKNDTAFWGNNKNNYILVGLVSLFFFFLEQRDVCWQLLSKLRSGMAVFEWKRLLFCESAVNAPRSFGAEWDSEMNLLHIWF